MQSVVPLIIIANRGFKKKPQPQADIPSSARLSYFMHHAVNALTCVKRDQ
jgi:hypothetical protein